MARLPRWLGQTSTRTDDGVTVALWLRPYHPSMLPVLWRLIVARPRFLKPVVVLWAWVYLMRRARQEGRHGRADAA